MALQGSGGQVSEVGQEDTGKQADRQIGRQADRQTGRQRSIGLEKKVKARKHEQKIKRTKVASLLFGYVAMYV